MRIPPAAGTMANTPQQFCLRWNNHQSNIVSVFEQLLHSEAFVDVTLAVEGMSLKAHKVVLSACSPYFQAVLASHPDKHPIVILKDVRYVDMRDLLDFMYRGEVSVDQDNLSGFLRVAESLRIKGLTEVNEKKRLESGTPPFLLSGNSVGSSGIVSSLTSNTTSLKRPPMSPTEGSFCKRRRGRPPKISGEESEGETVNQTQGIITDGEDSRTGSEAKDIKVEAHDLKDDANEDTREGESRTSESAGPSGELHGKDELKLPKEEPDHTRESPGSVTESEWTSPSLITRLIPQKRPRGRPPRVPRQPQDPSKWPPLLPKPSRMPLEISYRNKHQKSHSSNRSTNLSSMYLNQSLSSSMDSYSSVASLSPSSSFPIELRDLSGAGLPGGVLPLSVELGVGTGVVDSGPPEIMEQPMVTLQDMTEGVQMGIKVRGLDLMRYGRLENGVYKCTECERIQILKTFKTSYSFQRHAYLYHEGSPKRFPCPVCGKEFSRPDKRKSHLKEKHGMFNAEQVDISLDKELATSS